MRAVNLKVNRLPSTCGIQSGIIEVSWLPENGLIQNAFSIKIDVNGKPYFNSGIIESNEYSYKPSVAIPSRSSVRVYVALAGEDRKLGEYSEFDFITIPEKNEWIAKWIDPELVHPEYSSVAMDGAPLNKASYLKKEFYIEDCSDALLFATAHGIYNAYINGKSVEGYYMAPGSSCYDKRLQVQAYDVSSLLTKGKNEIIFTLGDGWWRGSSGYQMYRYTYGTEIALLCQLEINGKPIVYTDSDWVASQSGPLQENDTMRLERYNAMNVINDWHSVQVVYHGYDVLICSELPITTHERFSPTLITTPNGQKVLDFGQNFAGYVEINVNANGGEMIRLTHGEVLGADGNFQNDNYQNKESPICRQVIEYICKPGENSYHQTKSYYGFRYALVETDMQITGKEFTGVAVYSDMSQTGFFECGVDTVNRLFKNVIFSMKSNFVDVPTDCPHREKLGFSGDCQVFSESALYLMDSYPVLRRWLREMICCQYENGNLRHVVPPPNGPRIKIDGMDGSAGFSSAITIVVDRILKFFNRPDDIAEFYPAIKRWISYNLNVAKKKRPENEILPDDIKDYILDSGRHWGEWAEPGKMGKDYFKELEETGHAELATAFLALDCLLTSGISRALGYEDDSEEYYQIFLKAKKAYKYVFTDNGRINSNRQCHYVRPVAHDLLSEDEKYAAVNELVELLRRNNTCVGTGFLTTCHLCKVLSDYGRSDVAYDLLLNRNQPSWLYMVEHGATTIWENWFGIMPDGERKNSHNHYSLGAVAGWMMSYVLGIRMQYGDIVIKPYTDKRLGYAKGKYLSVYGEISSEWRYYDSYIEFNVTIPAFKSATFVYPDGNKEKLSSGKHVLKYSI